MKIISYLIFVGIFATLGFAGFVYNIWYNGDDITKKNIETEILFYKHALTDQSDEITKLIQQYHGDAPDSAIIDKFTKWGLGHQQEFLDIISKVKVSKDSESMTDRVAYSIYNGGSNMIKAFKNSYKDMNSKDLQEIYNKLTQLEKNQSTIEQSD